MTIAAAVTEAKNGVLLIAECRRCLSIGCKLDGYWIQRVIDLIENATIASLAGWTDIAANTALDGRNAAEVVVIA